MGSYNHLRCCVAIPVSGKPNGPARTHAPSFGAPRPGSTKTREPIATTQLLNGVVETLAFTRRSQTVTRWCGRTSCAFQTICAHGKQKTRDNELMLQLIIKIYVI